MNIAGTELNLEHKAFEIYLAGCKAPHCKGCHNPELHSFDAGIDYQTALPEIEAKIAELQAAHLINFIWILGGEPQHLDIEQLCSMLCKLGRFSIRIVLWTREDFIDVDVLQYVHFVKHGRYTPNAEGYVEPLLGIQLANKEQYILRGGAI